MELLQAFKFNPRHRSPCVIDPISMTVPDDSLSIKDILYRFSRGLPLDIHTNPPIYDDVEDDDFEINPMNEHLDMDEIYNEAVSSKETIDNYNKLIQNENVKDTPTSDPDPDKSSPVQENN